MRADHVFSRAHEMQRGKRLRSQTKEVIVNVYDYFEDVSRRQRTQGPLKRTLLYTSYTLVLHRRQCHDIIWILITLLCPVILTIAHNISYGVKRCDFCLTYSGFKLFYGVKRSSNIIKV